MWTRWSLVEFRRRQRKQRVAGCVSFTSLLTNKRLVFIRTTLFGPQLSIASQLLALQRDIIIMSATGHKNAQSLQSYARATDNQLDQMASVLDGRAAIAASKNPDVCGGCCSCSSWSGFVSTWACHQCTKVCCFRIVHQQWCFQASTWHMVLYSPSFSMAQLARVTLLLMLSPKRGCKYDFEAVTMVTPGCHGILLVPNLLL